MHRKRAELEEQLIVEEVERRVKEEIEKRVTAAMDSEAVQASLQQRLVAERKVLEEQVRVRFASPSPKGCSLDICLTWFPV